MEDEPFDTMGSSSAVSQASPATTQLRKATPSVPPPAAFGKTGGQLSTPPPVIAQLPPKESLQMPGSFKDNENYTETQAQTTTSRPSAAELEAAKRFLNDDDDDMIEEKKESSAQERQQHNSNYRLSDGASVATKGSISLAPRQPYSFKKSSSYDTEELIRKYGAMSGVSASMASFNSRPVATDSSKKTDKPGDVRQEAMKVLTLVDDHLNTPFDVRRTQSGGYRAAPRTDVEPVPEGEEVPYHVRRTASGTITSGSSDANMAGRRVPSALAGLDFSSDRSSWKAGRYSFSDPSFRDDDSMSVEDDIMHNGEMEDSPVIDVVSLENRAMSSRVHAEPKESFDGDYPQAPSSWSARYSDTFASQKRILDQWDREYDNERRTNARSMIMSTASTMRSAAGNAWTEAQVQGERVFGPGFSFRKNHVFGNQAAEKPEVNLRTVWKDLEGDGIEGTRVHRSWQEVMLNKKKRRRVLLVLFLMLAVVFTVVGVKVYGNNNGNSAIMAAGSNTGSSVSFYVTSDVPYDTVEETKLSKDLANIPADAEFIVHLGNIQQASQTFCPWNRYSNVASVLKESPVPMFVVPGAEDWANCPDPARSLHNWMDAFFQFDTKFVHGFEVFRDRVHPEAFAMLHNGVLFLGLHIVNAPVDDADTWASREMQMLTFYFGMTNLHSGQYRAIVILGNGRPSPQHDEFFNTIFASLTSIGRPMAYIHANSGSGTIREYSPYEDDKSIVGIEIEDGGQNPPLKITVGFGDRPFLVG